MTTSHFPTLLADTDKSGRFGAVTGGSLAPRLQCQRRRRRLCSSVWCTHIGSGWLCCMLLLLARKIPRRRSMLLCCWLQLQLKACVGAARGSRWRRRARWTRVGTTSRFGERLAARSAPAHQGGSRYRGSAA